MLAPNHARLLVVLALTTLTSVLAGCPDEKTKSQAGTSASATTPAATAPAAKSASPAVTGTGNGW